MYITYQQLAAGQDGWKAAGRGELVVVDKATFTVEDRIPVGQRPFAVAVDDYRGILYVLHYDVADDSGAAPLVALSRTAPYAEVARPVMLEPRSIDIAVNVAGNRVYTADGYVGQFVDPVGWLRVVDGATRRLDPDAAVRLPPEAVAVTYDPATRAAYVSLAYTPPAPAVSGNAPAHNGLAVVDGAGERLVRELALPPGHLPCSAAIDPTRNRAYVLTIPGITGVPPAVDVLDIGTGTVLASIPSGFGGHGQIGTTPGGPLVFAATGMAVQVVSAGTLDIVGTWSPAEPGRAPTSLDVDPGTGFVYVGDHATGEVTELKGRVQLDC